MALSSQQLNELVNVLVERGGMATTSQLDRAVSDLMKRSQKDRAIKAGISMSRIIRGLRVRSGLPAIAPDTAEADVKYMEAVCQKVLTTQGTPGSVLVPTIQEDVMLEYLNLGGVLRASGCRIWPMAGIQKATIPQAAAAPAWVWTAQNSQTTAVDPSINQVSFDLKERRTLVQVSNQLLATSVPAFDVLISELIAQGAAEHEDNTLFGSSQAANGPINILGVPSISTLNCQNSANGGSLAFSDIVAVLAKAASVKAKPPFAWYMSPRTFWSRVVSMTDTASRPIFIPTQVQGLQEAPRGQFYQGFLFGWPVWVVPGISESESVGSGSNQSHILFSNPQYIHLAQDSALSIAISLEYAFAQNMTTIRATQNEDAAVSPPAGLIALLGVN